MSTEQLHQRYAITSLCQATRADGLSPKLASTSEDCCAAIVDQRDLHCTWRTTAHSDFASAAAWMPPAANGDQLALLTIGWDQQLMRHDF